MGPHNFFSCLILQACFFYGVGIIDNFFSCADHIQTIYHLVFEVKYPDTLVRHPSALPRSVSGDAVVSAERRVIKYLNSPTHHLSPSLAKALRSAQRSQSGYDLSRSSISKRSDGNPLLPRSR